MLAAGAGTVAAAFLLADPSVSAGFPRCAFHVLTGLFCPGCGAQRALHALVHGRVADAVGYNAMAVAALPGLGVAALRWVAGRPATRPHPVWVGYAVLAGVVAFWALRNVPAAPFSTLAP